MSSSTTFGSIPYTAAFWEYDSRLIRRWNLDPVSKHDVSNYTVLGDNPILFVDPLGDDWFVNGQGFYIWSEQPSVHGFEYAGTELPEGVSKYRILSSKNGALYHKHMSNWLVEKWNDWFGTKYNPLKQYEPAEESFNEELWTTGAIIGAFKLTGGAFAALREAGGSIWKLPTIGMNSRGFVYEQMLNLKGMMKSHNFPVIDAFYQGVATSVKTLDIFAKTYADDVAGSAVRKQLEKYVDDLAGFNGRTWGGDVVKGSDITKRVLEVGIPKGASNSVVQQIQEAGKYAASKGIEMNVRVVR
ncbi:MAG: hypothetical protein J5I53_00060 [Bradyrhizobiaceae bacterium]|nr:hypothetical protein [Bradyrhizobiaceae bacterium]